MIKRFRNPFRSMHARLTAAFIALIAIFMVLLWVANNWFLEDFYLKYKVHLLENAYVQIDNAIAAASSESATSADAGGNDSVDLESIANNSTVSGVIQSLRDSSNISVLIYDSASGSVLVTSSNQASMMIDRVHRYILGQFPPQRDIIASAENYTIQKTQQRGSDKGFLESWGYFTDNGTIFIMTTPIDSIREAVHISNRLLVYTSLIILVAGAILIYFLTRLFTKPIYQLSRLSERMSNLDFSAKYEHAKGATSEIDTLGNSMNIMSDRLNEAIDELRSANGQLQKDIREKERIDEMRKEFIGDVSHELKTPIALIQGYAEGLVEGMAEDPENRDYYCGVILDEANKMNKMVKQLLTLTALELGNEQTEMRPFDICELVHGVVTANQLVIRNKEASVSVDAEKPLMVMGDEFQIEEVVTNYLNNALNHVDDRKKIHLRVIPMEDDKVRVTVFNTGTPIPQESLDKLWQKFYKVDKARTRAYGGSGIGLSIVKAIMDRHHEHYGVINYEDGVEFWFELSRAKEEPAKEKQ